MNKNTILHWLPRILTILFIGFLALFSLDVFSMEGSLLEKIGGFLIHNIPVYILVLLLVFAWKNEKWGGIIFIILGAIFTIYFRTHGRIDTFLLISFPLLLVGLLFLLHDRRMKKTL